MLFIGGWVDCRLWRSLVNSISSLIYFQQLLILGIFLNRVVTRSLQVGGSLSNMPTLKDQGVLNVKRSLLLGATASVMLTGCSGLGAFLGGALEAAAEVSSTSSTSTTQSQSANRISAAVEKYKRDVSAARAKTDAVVKAQEEQERLRLASYKSQRKTQTQTQTVDPRDIGESAMHCITASADSYKNSCSYDVRLAHCAQKPGFGYCRANGEYKYFGSTTIKAGETKPSYGSRYYESNSDYAACKQEDSITFNVHIVATSPTKFRCKILSH